MTQPQQLPGTKLPREDATMSDDLPSNALSHSLLEDSFEKAFAEREKEIRAKGDQIGFSVSDKLELLKVTASCEFGRFIIANRGLDGYWTDYVMAFPDLKDSEREQVNPVVRLLAGESPTARATQERFQIFRRELQKCVTEGAVMASVPCGLMRDLLSLDFSAIDEFSLFGSDIDDRSLELAKELSAEYGVDAHCSFFQGDAWTLQLPEKADVITSNGLNIYEPDHGRVVALYRGFLAQLNPGGLLITSCLTPPPTVDPQSEWRIDRINLDHAMRSKVLFSDVIGVAWQSFRSSSETIEQLREAGFSEIEVFYDRAAIFPTVTARANRGSGASE